MTKIPKWVWVALLGAGLALPLLGSFGLWDPSEIREADVARAVAEAGSFADITVGGKHALRPVLQTWLVAIGFRFFGVNELAGRLPLALCFIGALLLAFRFVRRLFDSQTALVASFALATTPVFLFQARQLTSDVAFYTMLIASLGGLLAYIAPADREHQRTDLIIGAVGLVGGFLARGLILGTALPIVAVFLALITSRLMKSEAAADAAEGASEESPEEDDASGMDVDAAAGAWVLCREMARIRGSLGVTLLAVGGIIGLLVLTLAQGKYLLTGGVFHVVALPPTFEKAIRDIGFGAFPWAALMPLALWSFGAAQREPLSKPGQERERFIQLAILLMVSLGYLLTVVWPGFFGKVRFVPLPWLVLATGIWAYRTYRDGIERPFWGVVAAILLLALHQDFYVRPESLSFSHLLDTLRYPEKLDIKIFVRIFGLSLAALAYFTLAGVPKIFTPAEPLPVAKAGFVGRFAGLGRQLLRWISQALDFCSWGISAAAGEGRRHFWAALALLTLMFAGWSSLWLMPELSLHTSNKALFQTYHQCRKDGERLAQYRVSGRGAAYYNKGQVDSLRSQSKLFEKLRKPERAFVLIPAKSLGAIDQAARKSRVTYHVLDDRNSHYLIISNKLSGAGCDKDKNPLREMVLRKRPTFEHKIDINFENKVRLIGYDMPKVVTRGGAFKIALYFEVLATLPANYKIFMHFDQPAARFHGDHPPLRGMYPTQYWLKGDFIKDPHEIELPLLTTSSGRYNIMMGFWQGSRRLKIVKGPNDGVNRAKIGVLRVR